MLSNQSVRSVAFKSLMLFTSAPVSIPVSFVLSADVSILVVVPSTILSIEKASHATLVGSYVAANISPHHASAVASRSDVVEL